MGDLVCINRKDDSERAAEAGVEETPVNKAVVPTIDIYSAKVVLALTKKMVEEAVDRRVTLLEKNIEERDREIMRTIRKMQARMAMQQGKERYPWWRRLFGRKQTR